MANGHLIAVVGGKGGVGKSVLTANIGIAYQQNFKQRPLILDLDLRSLGDQNIILGLNAKHNIADLCNAASGRIDSKLVAQFMTNGPAGFSYIAAPKDALVAQELKLDSLSRVLKGLKSIFRLTMVDCGDIHSEATLRVLEQATAIFVVTTPDLIVINQTKRVLAKLQELMFPPEVSQIIVNRVSRSSIVTPQMIQKNLGRPVFAMIPEDVAVCEASLAKNMPVVLAAKDRPMVRSIHDLVRKLQQTRLLEKLERVKKPSGVANAEAQKMAGAQSQSGEASSPADYDPWTALRARIHKALVEEMDLKKMGETTADPKQQELLRERTKKAVLGILPKEDTDGLLESREAKTQMLKEVLDEALGLGPLEDLLADDDVTEIMVNSRDQIFIEKNGKNSLSKVTFTSEQQMMNVVERIVTPLGRRVDEKVPYTDARLQDGSRVHVIIPPLALRGPTITIRKFPKERLTAKDLVNFGSMTKEIADFLRACVEAKLNIVVSGGTGSGKTTLLNMLSNFIPATDRIITVEDSAELNLGQDHVVRLETRPKNIEGEGEVSIRELVKCCLRMKPDRIVVGECRSGEALDMLQAMNTGHDGSLTTLHANNPRECIQRLETLVMMAGLELPSKVIRETISSAVNIIIQQSRLSDGSRKITHITEVTGIQGDVISLQDIFLYKQEGLDKRRKVIGRFVPTGFIPKFVEEMEAKGMKISRGLFANKKGA